MSLKSTLRPDELRKVKVADLVRGLNRGLDLLGGALRAFSSSGEVLHARTGMLARLWELERVAGEPLAWRFVNRSPQARILEEGGDVRPTKATALAIPMEGPALTERGVPRFPGGPRQAELAGHKLFVLKTGGKAYLVESVRSGGGKKGGGSNLVFWYALRGGVTIPAFHYASRAVASVKDQVESEVRNALAE